MRNKSPKNIIKNLEVIKLLHNENKKRKKKKMSKEKMKKESEKKMSKEKMKKEKKGKNEYFDGMFISSFASEESNKNLVSLLEDVINIMGVSDFAKDMKEDSVVDKKIEDWEMFSILEAKINKFKEECKTHLGKEMN